MTKKGTKVAKKRVGSPSSGITTIYKIPSGERDGYGADSMKTSVSSGSEREKLLRRIAELEALNRDLMGMVEHSYDGLAIADGDSRLLLLNPSFERVMGLSNEEIIGRPIRELVKEGVSDTAASLKVLETGKQQTVIINTKAGRQVLSTGVPVFDRDGNISRIYCNLRDITELNQLKEKYEQSQRLISRYLVELHDVKQYRGMRTQFVAHSKEMKQIVETAFRIGRVDATVLILGESGVGKELVARIIHEASPRTETGTFVKINCGAIPGELLESELFGYEGGAFTGASKEGKPGYFEIADKGTLLLDEIGDLPLKLQVKLLSVIQDHEVIRVGGTRPKRVDVRIVAATNQDLERMVKEGKFREDLFYRLNVVPLTIPPLRERREDIPFLLVHFLEMYNKKYARETRLSTEIMEKLSGCRWPGNVRELANLIEHLIVITNKEILKPKDLPKKYFSDTEEQEPAPDFLKSLGEEVERYELRLIRRTVSETKTLEEAAHKLGISLSTLTRRLRLVKRDGQK
jgi:PAS domain S-box-containing protein